MKTVPVSIATMTAALFSGLLPVGELQHRAAIVTAALATFLCFYTIHLDTKERMNRIKTKFGQDRELLKALKEYQETHKTPPRGGKYE